MTKSNKPNSKQNGKDKRPRLDGFLPCFERHIDNKFQLEDFYGNHVFVHKVREFLHAVVISPTTQILQNYIHAKGGIQTIDPIGNIDDRKLCERLGWQQSKVYRVDYGDNSYRILFGLDNAKRRCHILALDTKHQTRPGKHK